MKPVRTRTLILITVSLLAVLAWPRSCSGQEVDEMRAVSFGEATLQRPDLWRDITGTTQPTTILVLPSDEGYPTMHMVATLVDFPHGIGYSLQVYDCADSTFTTVLIAEATDDLSLVGTTFTPNPLWQHIGPRTNGMLILRAVCRLTPQQKGSEA